MIGGATHAFLYPGGTMYDLNSLVVSGLAGATLVQATAINDRGQIVASTCSIVPGCIAFRLDPVTAATVPALSREALGATALWGGFADRPTVAAASVQCEAFDAT